MARQKELCSGSSWHALSWRAAVVFGRAVFAGVLLCVFARDVLAASVLVSKTTWERNHKRRPKPFRFGLFLVSSLVSSQTAMSTSVKQEHVDDRTVDMLTALKEIKRMLAEEATRWYESRDSKTADVIGHYEVALDVLIGFVHEGNHRAFILAMIEYRLNIDQIRKCFYATDKVPSCSLFSFPPRAKTLFSSGQDQEESCQQTLGQCGEEGHRSSQQRGYPHPRRRIQGRLEGSRALLRGRAQGVPVDGDRGVGRFSGAFFLSLLVLGITQPRPQERIRVAFSSPFALEQ